LHAPLVVCTLKLTAWKAHHTPLCVLQQAQQKSLEIKASLQYISKSELQAAPDREPPDQVPKQLSVHSPDLASELNVSKKLPQFRMTEQDGQAAEEEEESKLS
jgi:hypothetical protein